MPVICGVKTPSERFAGAVETFSIEGLMQDNKALQAATSHDLGQNFARAFDVKFQAKDGAVDHVWATSWGMSTRVIGGLIMTHSDDEGLVLPPRIAGTKVVVVPIWKNDQEMSATRAAAQAVAAELRAAVGPVIVDDRDQMRPGWKYAEWERKGVPLRVEIGPRDLQNDQAMFAARHDHRKQTVARGAVVAAVAEELTRIQDELLARARQRVAANTHVIDSWDDFLALYGGAGGFAHAHWCGEDACELEIQDTTGVTIRNVPLERDESPGRCVRCGKPAAGRVVFAQAY